MLSSACFQLIWRLISSAINILARTLFCFICWYIWISLNEFVSLFLVWRGALLQPAWHPQSPPSIATPKPSWSLSTSAGTLRRTWRSSRSCWSWILQSRCGTCTSARCRALPRSCWTCHPMVGSSPTPPSSWTSMTCLTHRERSIAKGRTSASHCCVQCGTIIWCL